MNTLKKVIEVDVRLRSLIKTPLDPPIVAAKIIAR